MKRPDIDRKTLIRAGQAGGAALAVVLVVAAFVGLQAPEEALPPIATPLSLPSAAVAPAALPPPPKSEPPAEEPEDAHVQPTQSASAPSKPAQVRPPPERMVAKTPPKRAERPVARVTSTPAPPPEPFLTQTYEDGLRVKFKTVDDLTALIAEAHVDVVLEYPDGARYMLPKDLDFSKVTFRIPDAVFAAYVAEGSVSELVPNATLMDRLELHQSNVRFLAIMDANLRASVASAARRAEVDPRRSVLLIEAGPKVSVALARR